jgi:protocatechuate 3,4-dioxygenase beta subunit
VTHPEHLWADLDLRVDTDNVLVLRSGHALRGRVLGADGAPVADARVRIDNGADADTTSEAAGLFGLRPLEEAENAFVHVHAEGHALLAVQPVRTGSGAPPFLELRLEPALALAGRASDVDGRPLADALGFRLKQRINRPCADGPEGPKEGASARSQGRWLPGGANQAVTP